MLIDLDPDGGGVLIVGTDAELRELAEGLASAVEDGEAEGALLTGEGVETVTIRRLPEEGDGG